MWNFRKTGQDGNEPKGKKGLDTGYFHVSPDGRISVDASELIKTERARRHFEVVREIRESHRQGPMPREVVNRDPEGR